MSVRWYWLAPLSGAVLFGLYLATLTEVHTYDALSYILDVDRKPWPELFHPHHLLYGPFGALIRALAGALGWQGSVGIWLQVTNALVGALAVTGLFALCRVVTGATGAALAAAFLTGWSYAFWYYAVEVEVYTLAAGALIAALWVFIGLTRAPTRTLAVGLGVAQAMAVFAHQTNALLTLPVLLAIAVLPISWRDRWRLALAYLVPLTILVGGVYLWVALGVSGMRRWEEVWRWLTGYAQTGFWGGAIDEAKLAGLVQGWSDTLAMPGGAVIVVITVALILTGWRGIAALPRPLLVFLLSWLVVYGAFFLWWEPDNIEFWIASLPPLALLLSAALARGHPLDHWRAGAAGSLGLALALAMLALNLPAIAQRGDAGRDLQRQIAAALAANSQPGDLIIVPDGVLELYLPHYLGRTTVYSFNQAMAASGGDWSAACEDIQQRITIALTSGYAVLIAGEAQYPPPAPPGQPPTPVERFGLAPETVAACYTPVQPLLEPLPALDDLSPYQIIRRANDLAAGPGWDFRRGRWGWQISGVDADEQTVTGWRMTPTVDPALFSPPLLIAAADVAAIEIRLAATTAARDAQLFLLDPSGQTSEERSLRFTLDQSAAMITYRLDLADLPDPPDLIGRVRFDPVGVGDGGIVIVESIRLIHR